MSDIRSKAESLSTVTDGLPNHIHKSGVMPRISVLMPVYNNAAFLGEAVESILSQ
jgi:cellulose synthase/poly-beta-1,6-N-acetylglucosamine synthase-like glycosyltransferase